MKAISTLNPLLIPAIMAVIGILILLIFRRSIDKSVFIGTITFLAFYAFTVGIAGWDDLDVQWQLDQFYLNQECGSAVKLIFERELAMSVDARFAVMTNGVIGLVLGLAVYISCQILSVSDQS